jgi:molybdopterin-containing oxidoreductase family iron-sulfur binding subunit
MTIDLDRCTGCQACVVACKVENNVPFSSPEEAVEGREIAWIQVLATFEGEFPEIRARFMPVLCMHCDKPPCVPVCPTGATYKSEPTGIVAQIYPRCIGCRYCAVACPYTIKFFNWSAPAWPEAMQPGLSPDVSVRPKGVIEKCTFCSHRLPKARETAAAEKRELRDGDYRTACQETCPTRAITFGDLDDPRSRVSALVKSPRAFRLQEDLGTEPKVYYLREGEWNASPGG